MTRLPLSTMFVPLADLALSALPHGGQRTARRNAWAGMAADATRARARRDADAAVALAVEQAARSGTRVQRAR